MVAELIEMGASRAQVLDWADLYANVAYQARFSLLRDGALEAEIWRSVEARLPSQSFAFRAPTTEPKFTVS